MISVLLPTRGRPQQLREAISSLIRHSAGPVEILVAADTDDVALPEYGRMLDNRTVKWFVQEPFPTLAQKVNSLVPHASGDWMLQFTNDMIVTANMWDVRIIARMPIFNRAIGYTFVGNDEGKASLPILPRNIVAELGWFCPPHFPFWFSDSWMTELVTMSGKGIGIDLGVQHQPGVTSTQGLRDLAFWRHFFDATRPERIAYAAKLRGSPVPSHLIERCVVQSSHNPNPATYEHYERHAERIPMPRYAEAKAAAVAYLERLQQAENP